MDDDGGSVRTHVRRAGPEDAGMVARLLDDFNTEFGSPTPGAAVLAERLRRLLGSEQTRAWLGWQDPGGAPDGVALVTRRPNVWWDGPVDLLDELYVVPPRRSQGLGARLIAAVLDDARAGGVTLVEVPVDAPDADARRFYRRQGFQEIDPETGDHALLLWHQI
ncbi:MULTISPECIES: GNAT family N-acetyltransferase [unclassified Nesterenkonia]|uniref:GNAT family N-acetyltransferase n=1 Tax=unclassified Nesterenkonia TaxID=2629769 RepID=UPI000871C1D2|nr:MULTISPECIES: GNAT family N-acetyltransferase [unclassified Nesterenkonia]MDS2172901.1 GNAT family N-acetyltransferase [Nesterenkonia sp. CL21]OSM42452.1 hypothetical protein BCY76_014345 [Nesterenkonia sp. PF2B19]